MIRFRVYIPARHCPSGLKYDAKMIYPEECDVYDDKHIYRNFDVNFALGLDGKIYCMNWDYALGAQAIDKNDVVIPMLSTGLKDKRGKEIFEGDLFTFRDSEPIEMRRDDLGFYYVPSKFYRVYLGGHQWIKPDESGKVDILEVIGNIHENPELLESN